MLFLISFFVVYVHFVLQRGFRPTPIAIFDVPTCFVAHCFRATRERLRDDRDAGNFITPRSQQNIKVISNIEVRFEESGFCCSVSECCFVSACCFDFLFVVFRAYNNPCCGRLNCGDKLMVPMVFGHFSLLFIFMLESGTNYVRGRIPFGRLECLRALCG